jgi:Icc-related predicted phosphoesterase
MRIVAISDTHEQEDNITLPEGDMLVCAGDITKKGSLAALYKFCAWMKAQDFKHKVMIYGNHEIGFSYGPKREEALATPKQFGITYLENSSVEIEGIKFYGSPVQPWFHDWEWNVHRGPDIARVWEAIPDDTQVLITHGPPFGILDSLLEEHPFFPAEKLGCEDLLNRINQLSELKAHIFGHIHSGHGILVGPKGVQFINAAICGDVYRHTAVNDPIVIDI